MEAVQRSQDAASRYAGASAPGVSPADRAAAYQRNASLEAAPPEPADNETTVTLSARAQQLATQPQVRAAIEKTIARGKPLPNRCRCSTPSCDAPMQGLAGPVECQNGEGACYRLPAAARG